MLSYRHSFHAGNFADVLKHIVLVEILDYLNKKDTGYEYIDTHSGAGLFNLRSNDAQKLQEYNNGIAKLDANAYPELAAYFELIRAVNPTDNLAFYPGSPAIAQYFLRPQDRAWLYELHPKDYSLLCDTMAANKKIRVKQQDGLSGMLSLMPPTSRRGLVLIDPSYEIKTEYQLVADSVIKAHKKFSSGIFAIWYPVVDRSTIDRLEKNLVDSGIKNIQRFELGINADNPGRGMNNSGMIVINPPWTLLDKMSNLLPKLAKTISETDDLFFKCDVLAAE